MTRERECQADLHVNSCACLHCKKEDCGNCHATNEDHFTGRAIGKLLGWTRKEINSPDNLQRLSKKCHKEKDRLTNEVLRDLRQQRKGRFIGLGEHTRIGI